jgi:hypothetical protein
MNFSVFSWARIATAIAIWALLYVLVSIDPSIRDKIGAARDLAGLVQTAPGSPGPQPPVMTAPPFLFQDHEDDISDRLKDDQGRDDSEDAQPP